MVVLKGWGQIWPCLQTFLFVTTGGGILLASAAKHSLPKTAPYNKNLSSPRQYCRGWETLLCSFLSTFFSFFLQSNSLIDDLQSPRCGSCVQTLQLPVIYYFIYTHTHTHGLPSHSWHRTLKTLGIFKVKRTIKLSFVMLIRWLLENT